MTEERNQPRKTAKTETHLTALYRFLVPAVSGLLSACAGDPLNLALLTLSQVSTGQQALQTGYLGTHVQFDFSNFYSITQANPRTGCPGDILRYYDFLATLPNSTSANNPLGLPSPLPSYASNSAQTLQPNFIKNISVDVTDANSTSVLNQSMSCSYGISSGFPVATSCSSFDYSSASGTDSPSGGRVLIMGGIQSANPAGIGGTSQGMTLNCAPSPADGPNAYPSCTPFLWSLGVNTLPAQAAGTSLAPGASPTPGPTLAISNWSNLSSYLTAPYTARGLAGLLPPSMISGQTPQGIVAAGSAFNIALQTIVLFGGASLTSLATPLNGVGLKPATYDTWSFNTQSGQWTSINSFPTVSSAIMTTLDNLLASQPSPTPVAGLLNIFPVSRAALGRGLFGYTPLAGVAISQFGQTGNVGPSFPGTLSPINSPIDTTERLIISGGLCNGALGVCTDTLKFNPTYGPEFIDAANLPQPIQTASFSSIAPNQWLDSYHTQMMSNAYSENGAYPSQLSPYFPSPSPLPASPIPQTQYGWGVFGFGMIGLTNNDWSSTTGSQLGGPTPTMSPDPAGTPTPNTPGAGYLLSAGGFYGLTGNVVSSNAPKTTGGSCLSNNASDQNSCGGLAIQLKWHNASTTSYSTLEQSAAEFISLTNLLDSQGSQTSPARWVNFDDGANALPSPNKSVTPWFGGANLVRGLNLTSYNEAVYFGGATCSDFLLSASTIGCTWNSATTHNPGKYWNFGPNPSASYSVPPSVATPRATATPVVTPFQTESAPTSLHPPYNAGMATARGVDPSNNPLIIAWGGMAARGTLPTPTPTNYSSQTIYYLWNNASIPTWSGQTLTSPAVTPPAMVNASLVFSHVTGKFYLFGGYDPTQGLTSSSTATWELSFDPAGPQPTNCATQGSCQFKWRALTPTCYPNCTSPPARRGHRMAEVNYHYFNAPFEPQCKNSNTPCSFGIFMEGGSPDGTNRYLADRWMFDPTANASGVTSTSGPQGHWQLMPELPPRVFSSMSNIDYALNAGSGSGSQHVALLFGGETGSTDPTAYSSGNYFVPPTLGDTWMYDYTTTHWNRVQLLGTRYTSGIPMHQLDEAPARGASTVDNTLTQILAPPPLSGAMMITRTLLRPNHSTSDTPSNLTLPEVFLFGGRNKAGKYQPLSQVYKFCAGSTGEKPYPMSPTGARIAGPDDATCDAYHSTTNPNSTNPQAGYIGRWLFKNPKLSSSPGTFDINPDLVGSYLGAAVYDPSHDLILAYGGLTPNALATPQASTSTNLASTWAVTSPTNQQLNNTDGSIYEYTPPSSVQGDPVTSPRIHGMWSRITPCTGPTPTARYGHSLVYDPLKQIVILTGGLDASGAPLTTSITNSSGTTYSVPETWTLQRNDSTSYNPCYNWTKVTNFGNKTDTLLNLPVNSGVAHAATFLIPATGYNTGYYTMNGPSCAGIGTVTGTDQNMGGIYIDIDRTRLGANDNLLLNLTLFPLGTSNIDTTGNAITSAQSAFFRVSLVSTGQSALQLQNQTQPRALIYSDTGSFPVKAYNLAILAPPTGQIRQEQVFIPLAIDPTIDRIRVERISGTGLILDATINRLPHS